MSKKPRKINVNINLIPKDPFFDSVLGRVLKWALSVGRYLVIFTELVVIVSFATRFSLDRQVTDLNSSLNQNQQVINSYGDLESKILTIQSKINDFKQLNQQENITEIFPKLTSVTPQGIVLEDLTITPETISLSGIANSQNSLNVFLNNMQVSGKFFAINVDKIESKGSKDPSFIFSLKANTIENVKTNVKQSNKIDERDDVVLK